MTDAAPANETRGEISLALEGVEYVLRPSNEAIVAMEEKTGRSLIQLAQAAGTGGMPLAHVGIVVTECIRAWGRAVDDNVAKRVTPERIRDLVIESGLLPALKRLELLLFMAATGGYTASGEVRAAARH